VKTENRAESNCYCLLTALCALFWKRFNSSSVPQVRCQNANWAVGGHLVCSAIFHPWPDNSFISREPWNSGLQQSVITRFYFNVSTFRDWFRRIGIRQRDWQIWFPHTPAPLCYCTYHSRFSQVLPFINKVWLPSWSLEWSSPSVIEYIRLNVSLLYEWQTSCLLCILRFFCIFITGIS